MSEVKSETIDHNQSLALAQNQNQNNVTDVTDTSDATDVKYDIEYLLDRAFGSFSLDKGKIALVTPVFEKKDRKAYIHNFQAVCASINRSPEEVRLYLGKELNMDTSVKEDGSLKIDGMPKNGGIVEKFIRDYVVNYIMCKSCKSCKTTVQKVDRINFLVCSACKSKRAMEKR